MYEEDNADLVGYGATGAIVLHVLHLVVKFTITFTMIQLLNIKGMFRETTIADANQHLMNFVGIYNALQNPGVNLTAMRLRIFSLSITGEATNLLKEMLDDSIRIWGELKEACLQIFFTELKEFQMKDKINNHKQLPR